MSKILALLQARMSSSRFPGKVLEPLGGVPMIVFMVERARRARRLDDVVVVTSVDQSDDPLADTLAGQGISCFRGDLHDVLGRYAAAAEAYAADIIVRLTGDCPLVDATIIDEIVDLLVNERADYASNIDPPTYADGLDVEAFTRAALDAAHARATALADREHVTLWMRSEGAGLKRSSRRAIVDSSHLRLTVDYRDDLELVRHLIHMVDADRSGFDHYDILRCLDQHRELLEINRHARNEGLTHSVATPGPDTAGGT